MSSNLQYVLPDLYLQYRRWFLEAVQKEAPEVLADLCKEVDQPLKAEKIDFRRDQARIKTLADLCKEVDQPLKAEKIDFRLHQARMKTIASTLWKWAEKHNLCHRKCHRCEDKIDEYFPGYWLYSYGWNTLSSWEHNGYDERQLMWEMPDDAAYNIGVFSSDADVFQGVTGILMTFSSCDLMLPVDAEVEAHAINDKPWDKLSKRRKRGLKKRAKEYCDENNRLLARKKQTEDAFVWLVLFQIKRWSSFTIEKYMRNKKDILVHRQNVESGVKEAAELLIGSRWDHWLRKPLPPGRRLK